MTIRNYYKYFVLEVYGDYGNSNEAFCHLTWASAAAWSATLIAAFFHTACEEQGVSDGPPWYGR